MNSQEIAENFVLYFCRAELHRLESVLADNFQLQGPLLQTNSRSEYLEFLSENLEPDPDAKILASFGSAEKAAVFYIYHGNTIGQLFVCNESHVIQTTLVFDTKNLA